MLYPAHLQPEISDYYEKVIPLLVTAMGDNDIKVKAKACYGIEAFCQNLGKPQKKKLLEIFFLFHNYYYLLDEECIAPYLQELMTRLVATIQQSELEVQEIAVVAISAIASVAGTGVVPYYQQLLQMMLVMMQQV